MLSQFLGNMYRLMQYIIKKGYKTNGFSYMSLTQVHSGEILAGKRIIITGGSSGIGFAIARRCVEEGALVLITGRNEEKLQNAVEKLGGRCHYLVHDIRNLEIQNYSKMLELLGGVDCLVNNAGISPQCEFLSVNETEWQNIMQTNLTGHYFITQFFADTWLKKNTSGNIVNVISNSGIVGLTSPYSVSKHGLVSITEGIAKQFYNQRIRCNGVAPDVTISEITDWSKKFDKHGNLNDPGVKHGRVFLAEEIAEVVLFLLSDASICINGQILACDNGISLSENSVG